MEVETQQRPPQIHAAIIRIMRAVGPIAKDQRNTQQNYNFRGIDQIYNACHPHFAEHGVYCTSEVLDAKHTNVQSSTGKSAVHAILKMRFTYWAEDGSSVSTEVIGEGMDYGGDKASNKAMSTADKYALLQLLKIPTAMVDADRDYDPPPRNGDAPRVTPRTDRVSPEDIKKIIDAWKGRHQSGNAEHDKSAFVEWVRQATGRQFNVQTHAMWTMDDVTKCVEAIKTEEGY